MNAADSASHILGKYWDRQYPVDVLAIAKSIGIDCKVGDLNHIDDNLDGALYINFNEEMKKPLIIVNTGVKSQERMRFTLAHEVGHYVDMMLNRPEELKEKHTIIEFRNKKSASGVDAKEIFANQFAANLLMPKNAVISLKQASIPSSDMASIFGVSNQAIMIRIASLYDS